MDHAIKTSMPEILDIKQPAAQHPETDIVRDFDKAHTSFLKKFVDFRRQQQIPLMLAPVSQFRRRQVTGRLVSLAHASNAVLDYITGKSQTLANSVEIHFPSMPDSIDLVRQANYIVTSNFLVPDGVHQFRDVAPLEIPFKFSLHAFDDDCPEGSLTLLRIAGQLHALQVPINTNPNLNVEAKAVGFNYSGVSMAQEVEDLEKEYRSTNDSVVLSRLNDAKNRMASTRNEAGTQQRADTPAEVNVKNGQEVESVKMPVAVYLDLISAGTNQPGVACVGYIKAVDVKLKGPFLRGQQSDQYNLPTSADYAFTFVHRPGHTNDFLGLYSQPGLALGLQANAFADDIKNKLFNTVGLLSGRVPSYQGFAT